MSKVLGASRASLTAFSVIASTSVSAPPTTSAPSTTSVPTTSVSAPSTTSVPTTSVSAPSTTTGAVTGFALFSRAISSGVSPGKPSLPGSPKASSTTTSVSASAASAAIAASTTSSGVAVAAASRRVCASNSKREPTRSLTPPILPRVPPTVAAKNAASPYSARASSEITSIPAWYLSITCCATSTGISAAVPFTPPTRAAPNRVLSEALISLFVSVALKVRPLFPPTMLRNSPLPSTKACPADSIPP